MFNLRKSAYRERQRLFGTIVDVEASKSELEAALDTMRLELEAAGIMKESTLTAEEGSVHVELVNAKLPTKLIANTEALIGAEAAKLMWQDSDGAQGSFFLNFFGGGGEDPIVSTRDGKPPWGRRRCEGSLGSAPM